MRPQSLSPWAIALCAFALSPLAVSAAEPYASWYDISHLGPDMAQNTLESRRRSVPSRSHVGISKFPGALLYYTEPENVNVARATADITTDLRRLLLVSDNSSSDVVRWYEENLADFSKFKEGDAVFFFNGNLGTFDASRDSCILLRIPHVIVRKIDSKMKRILPSYATMIEVAYRPQMAESAPSSTEE